MALRKIKELNTTGVTGDYWRLTQINFDFLNNKIYSSLQLYKDQASRSQGKNPLARVIEHYLDPSVFSINVELEDGTVINLLNLLLNLSYSKIKDDATVEDEKPIEDQNCDLIFLDGAEDC